MPIDFVAPAGALRSLVAFRAHQKTIWFPAVSDTSRFEAYLRDLVVIQSDGTVRPRMTDSVATGGLTHYAHRPAGLYQGPFARPRDLRRDILDVRQRGIRPNSRRISTGKQKYIAPFRAASIERVRRELPSVEIVKVPGTHKDFVFYVTRTSGERDAALLRGNGKRLLRVRFAKTLAALVLAV